LRTKIDYGIDLGTTNSSISRFENGKPVILKTDIGSDFLPTCVHFNKKKDTLVGQTADDSMKNENINALKSFDSGVSNSFIEFNRTLGTDHKYFSENMGREFTSEELSAEVLKTLKSFIVDEQINSVVLAVPAKLTNTQKEATIKAVKLAGFKQVELISEPVAVLTAFGLNSKLEDANYVIFDFGGGKFDAALVNYKDGILMINDLVGDNFLGGRNIDIAIVDQIIIPYIRKNYSIEFVIENTSKKEILRNVLKLYAEQAKIQLSFKESYHLVSNLPFEDENGIKPEIDINLTQEDLEEVLSPIFQKAINITKDMLHRNNLKETDVSSLILVGGPTHSPILRNMLRVQITENLDSSIDPMTAVARGAALVSSTLGVTKEDLELKRDTSKIQLELEYDAATIENQLLVSLKILPELTKGKIPDRVYVDIVRSKGAISTGKKAIGEKRTFIELQLAEGHSNLFNIYLFDETGNFLKCQPNQIRILQGVHFHIRTDSSVPESKKEMLKFDDLKKDSEWLIVEKELKDSFFQIEDLMKKIYDYGLNSKLNIEKVNQHILEQRKGIERIAAGKNIKEAKELISELLNFDYYLRNEVTDNALDVSNMKYFAEQFENYQWTDRNKARSIINQGLNQAAAGNNHLLRNLLNNLFKLLPEKSKLEIDSTLSYGIDLGTTNSTISRIEIESKLKVPTSRIDKVHFSVSSQQSVKPGQKFIIDVWAHLEKQRAAVQQRIEQASYEKNVQPIIRSKGPFKIERGTILYVQIRLPDFNVEPSEDAILWEGEIGNASFVVDVPVKIKEGIRFGFVSVHWEGGLQIAGVPIQILISKKIQNTIPETSTIKHVRKAFASYSSDDREEVLISIQGMQKISPDLEVFYDEKNLRSGDNWKKMLKKVIPENDIFYLFWSASAKESHWVDMEWRWALKSKGIWFIDPVPLVSPEDVPPPEELSGKHFKDWLLAYRRAKLKGS